MVPELGVQIPEHQNKLQDRLISDWIDSISATQGNEHTQPIINRDSLQNLLTESNATQQPITFIALGCQDWIKTGETERMIGRIQPENKRARRFSHEISSFSHSLDSIGIPHHIHFSLSDIEGLLHMNLHNMGHSIVNADAHEIQKENVQTMVELIQSDCGNIQQFMHSEVIQQITGVSSLEELQQMISSDQNPSFRQFLNDLYAFDLTHTANYLTSCDSIGTVWLNIQGQNTSDSNILIESAQRVAPELPILSVFPNAGNWHAKHRGSAHFPQKKELLAQKFNFEKIPDSDEEWFRRMHKSNDAHIAALFAEITGQIEEINDAQQKSLIVRQLFLMAFGFDPLDENLHIK